MPSLSSLQTEPGFDALLGLYLNGFDRWQHLDEGLLIGYLFLMDYLLQWKSLIE